MIKIFNLENGIGAHLIYMNPISSGSEIYRLIFEIYSDPQQPHFFLKEYEIWVSLTFIEDYQKLQHEPTSEEIFSFSSISINSLKCSLSLESDTNGIPPYCLINLAAPIPLLRAPIIVIFLLIKSII